MNPLSFVILTITPNFNKSFNRTAAKLQDDKNSQSNNISHILKILGNQDSAALSRYLLIILIAEAFCDMKGYEGQTCGLMY